MNYIVTQLGYCGTKSDSGLATACSVLDCNLTTLSLCNESLLTTRVLCDIKRQIASSLFFHFPELCEPEPFDFSEGHHQCLFDLF